MNDDEFEKLLWVMVYCINHAKGLPGAAGEANDAVRAYQNSEALFVQTPPEVWEEQDAPF